MKNAKLLTIKKAPNNRDFICFYQTLEGFKTLRGLNSFTPSQTSLWKSER